MIVKARFLDEASSFEDYPWDVWDVRASSPISSFEIYLGYPCLPDKNFRGFGMVFKINKSESHFGKCWGKIRHSVCKKWRMSLIERRCAKCKATLCEVSRCSVSTRL
ncbi:hypothetical protein CEXT_703991 [Caerostris extrusa]|uniref:Uncharacterized protein n=1 Tax=Caerostris extrusa TaxID=172846 RepID=A0AAV4VKD7_CAEEX|nr:hypothetical protein CEXT_703991 [Caerostris extrusa]